MSDYEIAVSNIEISVQIVHRKRNKTLECYVYFILFFFLQKTQQTVCIWCCWLTFISSVTLMIHNCLFVCLFMAFILLCFNFLLSFKFLTKFYLIRLRFIDNAFFSMCLSHLCLYLNVYVFSLFVYKSLFYATNQYWIRQKPNKEEVKY